MAASGRDGDRQRVYDAEDAAFLDTSYAERLGERGCRWLLDRLTATAWWATAAGAPPTIRAARADSTRSTTVLAEGRAEVRIGPGMDQPHVLSHELAHVVAGLDAGHGPPFRAAHLDVAAAVLGGHGAGRLAQAYERARLTLGPRWWPAPPDHGPGGLLAIWESRVILEARHLR
ncbi:MAG: hypothetical protein ABIS47_02595 [Acidimicrobiales bacterium]